MATTNATDLRKNLFTTLDSVIDFNEQVTINTRKGNAVLISEEEYNSLMETIFLASQPGMVEAIKEGEKEDPKDMKTFDPDEEW